jgi:L-threonylcarbamoyladenylate synthase
LLRQADHLGLDVLYIEGVPEADLGLAIMNRLRKAADYREIKT